MKHISHKSALFKMSLLSISLAIMLAPAISPALPLMHFNGVSQSQIDTLCTIPNLMKIVGILVSPLLIKLIGQKKTIITGLLGVSLLGIIPLFSNSYLVILISRLAVGFAFGLFMALATGLIVQIYREDKNTMAHMMGYQNTIQTLGSALASFVVGFLVTLGWHQAFLVYLIPIPLVVIFGLFVNDIDTPQVSKDSNKPKTKFKFTGEVWLIIFFMLFTLILYMPTNFTLPRLIISAHMGSARTAANITGILRLFTMVTAALFGFLMKHIGDKVFPIGFIIQFIAYYLITISTNIPFLLFSLLLLGIGNSLVLPYIYNWMGLVTNKETSTTGQSVLMIALNIGTVISPTFVNGINSMMGTQSPRNIMMICAIGNVILAIAAIIRYVSHHKAHLHHQVSAR